jgi:hypothetical protein
VTVPLSLPMVDPADDAFAKSLTYVSPCSAGSGGVEAPSARSSRETNSPLPPWQMAERYII